MKYHIDVTMTVTASMMVRVDSFEGLRDAAVERAKYLAFAGYANTDTISEVEIEEVDNWDKLDD